MDARHEKEIRRFVDSGDFVETPEGVLIHGCIIGRGLYHHTVNGEDLRVDPNLLVTEGINYILDAAFGNGTQEPTWYLAPFSGVTPPAPTWTGANFDSNASEITSASEGYSQASRPEWVEDTPAAGVIDNLSSRAVFTIVTASTLDINGAGLLSASGKANGVDILASATAFGSTRTLNDADTFELGYSVTLTDS